MRLVFEFMMGIVKAVLLIFLVLLYLWSGYKGIEFEWGWGWAIAVLLLAMFSRATLPLAVGCYLYAHKVWEWNWFFALLFATPGLIYMIPDLITTLFKSPSSNR